MPHYVRTGLEIVGSRFCGVRNPTFNLNHYIVQRRSGERYDSLHLL